MVSAILLLCLGFLCLYFGANWLVNGACSIAVSLNISKVVVGVVLVAFGTSAPELFVNLIAAFRGYSGIALSNISGSNLTNICIGFGLCSILGNLQVHRKEFWFDIVYFCAAPLVVLIFLFVFPRGRIPYFGSFILIGLFSIYILSVRSRLFETEQQVESGVKAGAFRGFLVFLAGIVTLYFGGEVVLENALVIGRAFGASESILGLTVVAVGTSLPDVMASVIAIRRNELSIAVGNLLGSNVFNILLVLGGTLFATGEGMPANNIISIDYAVVFAASLLFTCLGCTMKRLHPLIGLGLIGGYLVYILLRITVLN